MDQAIKSGRGKQHSKMKSFVNDELVADARQQSKSPGPHVCPCFLITFLHLAHVNFGPSHAVFVSGEQTAFGSLPATNFLTVNQAVY